MAAAERTPPGMICSAPATVMLIRLKWAMPTNTMNSGSIRQRMEHSEKEGQPRINTEQHGKGAQRCFCSAFFRVSSVLIRGYLLQQRLDDVRIRHRGVGQAVVAALVREGELGVVEAQGVQQRGVQVADADDVLDRRGSRSRRSRRGRSRFLKPPPASQSEKAWRLWSRPSVPCEIGSRPNSPVHITMVESSRPRRFRSCTRPALG